MKKIYFKRPEVTRFYSDQVKSTDIIIIKDGDRNVGVINQDEDNDWLFTLTGIKSDWCSSLEGATRSAKEYYDNNSRGNGDDLEFFVL